MDGSGPLNYLLIIVAGGWLPGSFPDGTLPQSECKSLTLIPSPDSPLFLSLCSPVFFQPQNFFLFQNLPICEAPPMCQIRAPAGINLTPSQHKEEKYARRYVTSFCSRKPVDQTCPASVLNVSASLVSRVVKSQPAVLHARARRYKILLVKK